MENLVIKPIKQKFFTPGVLLITLIALNGFVFILLRFLFGIGYVTNLNDQYPWGLWIGVDVAAGVALAAGGFMTAAIGHIFHREEYFCVVRPALLTAMLGYTFVAFAVFIDIGRWYYIWHPLIMWNPNSALFEVGICVMTYVTVLYIEFMPILTERFLGKVNLPGILKIFNNFLEFILKLIDKTLNKVQFVFIIAGVVLSSLHQSSLGTLMIIAGDKMHPLWQTPVLPLLFLISAVAVGFPMVVFESLIAARSFKLKPEIKTLARLASNVPLLLGIYIAFKIGDMAIRKTYVYLSEINIYSIAYFIEMLLLIIPAILLNFKKVLTTPLYLFISATMIVAGVLINRINNFIVAYTPPYKVNTYIPSFGEFSVTIGCIALLILLYRAFVMIFPIIAQPKDELKPNIN
jgi:Ni/Fe-hydrogenase subunit HybB-like protein